MVVSVVCESSPNEETSFPVNFSVVRKATLGKTLGNSCSHEDEERYRVREDTGGRLLRSHFQSYFKMSFFHHSDFCISLKSNVIQRYWIDCSVQDMIC